VIFLEKTESNQLSPNIVYATKESRELFRIRNSFTFKLGLEFTKCFKNPIRIFILPIRIIMLLLSKKTPVPIEETVSNNFLIIGVDRVGQRFSKQSEFLSNIIIKSELGEVTLINNSLHKISLLDAIEWYRLPPIREKNRSRKEWNLIMERLLSSAISISRPKHIIYFGDYLYRGITNAFSSVNSNTPITWFLPNPDPNKPLQNERLPRVNPVLLPEFTDEETKYQSIHRILKISESKTIILSDINSSNELLFNSLLDYKNDFILTGIQRGTVLPDEIKLIIRVKDISRAQLEGNILVVLDDSSPIIPSLSTLNVPCLLLRTGKILSPILDVMIRELELNGSLIVVRRNTLEEIQQSLCYLTSISANDKIHSFTHRKSAIQAQSSFVVDWLKKQTYS